MIADYTLCKSDLFDPVSGDVQPQPIVKCSQRSPVICLVDANLLGLIISDAVAKMRRKLIGNFFLGRISNFLFSEVPKLLTCIYFSEKLTCPLVFFFNCMFSSSIASHSLYCVQFF